MDASMGKVSGYDAARMLLRPCPGQDAPIVEGNNSSVDYAPVVVRLNPIVAKPLAEPLTRETQGEPLRVPVAPAEPDCWRRCSTKIAIVFPARRAPLTRYGKRDCAKGKPVGPVECCNGR